MGSWATCGVAAVQAAKDVRVCRDEMARALPRLPVQVVELSSAFALCTYMLLWCPFLAGYCLLEVIDSYESLENLCLIIMITHAL
jgi:hypothetical protein